MFIVEVFYLALNLDRFITFNTDTLFLIIFNITMLNSYKYIHNCTKVVREHNTNIGLATIIHKQVLSAIWSLDRGLFTASMCKDFSDLTSPN